MNFTNKYISNTYGSVMVNDPFTNDNPSYVKSTILSDIFESDGQYVSIFDGNGLQGNLFLTLSGTVENEYNPYPYSCYQLGKNSLGKDCYFYIPGDGLSANQVLYYEALSSSFTLSSSDISIGENYITFKNTRYPIEKIPNNSVLTIKDGTIGSSTELLNKMENKREKYVSLNNINVVGNNVCTLNFNCAKYINLNKCYAVIIRVESKISVLATGHGVDTYISYNRFGNVWTQLGCPYPITDNNYSAKNVPGWDMAAANNVDQTFILPVNPNIDNTIIVEQRRNPNNEDRWYNQTDHKIKPVGYVTYGYENGTTSRDNLTTRISLLGAFYVNTDIE